MTHIVPCCEAYHVNQFHPIVYIVKLHIEMTMSRKPLAFLCERLRNAQQSSLELLIKVARSTGISVYTEDPERATAGTVSGNRTRPNSLSVYLHKHPVRRLILHSGRFMSIPKCSRLGTWTKLVGLMFQGSGRILTLSSETTPKNKHLSTASADSTESSAGPSA